MAILFQPQYDKATIHISNDGEFGQQTGLMMTVPREAVGGKCGITKLVTDWAKKAYPVTDEDATQFQDGCRGKFLCNVPDEEQSLFSETNHLYLLPFCVTSSDKSGSEEDKLLKQFDEALDIRPYLLFEIGYNRVTGWMVHIWDSEGVGISKASKVVVAQELDRELTCHTAGLLLKEYMESKQS